MNNPVGILGVEFTEFSGPKEYLSSLFERFGFKKVSQSGSECQLFRQGQVNFIVTTQGGTNAIDFTEQHGPCISAMGWKVKDAATAFKVAVERGAKPFTGAADKKGSLNFPAVYGIGDSLIYFIDETGSKKLFTEIFTVATADLEPKGVGFKIVDHFTNNVPKGEMDKWVKFYQDVFGFNETRYFNIQGKQTGLFSKVMRSPSLNFSIPINEPADGKSQIQEYLEEYKGSGVQHLALLTDDILQTMKDLKSGEVQFLTPPPTTYYSMLKDRLPMVKEDIGTLEKEAILVDGDPEGYLLQIFTKNIIGPIFFEIIQRKNHHGFGEGNFQALFDAIERDQKERGYL